MGYLIAFGGEEETQEQLHSMHCSKEFYKQIATEMRAWGHDQNWSQCRVKTKWMVTSFK